MSSDDPNKLKREEGAKFKLPVKWKALNAVIGIHCCNEFFMAAKKHLIRLSN